LRKAGGFRGSKKEGDFGGLAIPGALFLDQDHSKGYRRIGGKYGVMACQYFSLIGIQRPSVGA